jgi:hypothetical protein
MDHIYNNIMTFRSSAQLDDCLQQLSAHGLYPLPDRPYTRKYTWFRRLTASKGGRMLMLRLLPLTKRER